MPNFPTPGPATEAIGSARDNGDGDGHGHGHHLVPAAITELSIAWLAAALKRDHPASQLHDFRAQRIGVDFGFASELHRLQLSGSGVPLAVVIKLWHAADAAGLNEVRFYNELAPGVGPPLPRCHHAQADAASGRGVLVLEDLSHRVQGDCLDLISLRHGLPLVQALATLHARWWRDDGRAPRDGLPPGLRTDRDDSWYAQRRDDFLHRFPGVLQGAGQRLLERIETRVVQARQRLLAGPVTLLHRDLHLDNVLFAPTVDGEGGVPCLIDWAQIGWEPPTVDLAAVVFELEDLNEQHALSQHYLATLRQCRPAVQVDAAAFEAELNAALLLRFSTATCGVARWPAGTARAHAIVAAGIMRAQRLAVHHEAIDAALFGP